MTLQLIKVYAKIQVMDMLYDSVMRHMDTFTLTLSIPDSIVEAALELWNSKVNCFRTQILNFFLWKSSSLGPQELILLNLKHMYTIPTLYRIRLFQLLFTFAEFVWFFF